MPKSQQMNGVKITPPIDRASRSSPNRGPRIANHTSPDSSADPTPQMASLPTIEILSASSRQSNGRFARKYGSKQPKPHKPASTGSHEEPPAAATEIDQDDDDDDNKHFTRSRRPDRKNGCSTDEQNGNHSSHPWDESLSTERSINECATLLSRADERSYQRAMVQDATSILEGFLFPMCFPWAHSIVPVVRIFPKDIDEMPAIVHCDDEAFTPFEKGTFGYGGFEVGKERRSHAEENKEDQKRSPLEEDKDEQKRRTPEGGKEVDAFRAATRRSNDVGVIELTVVDPESMIDDFSCLRKRKRNVFCESEDSPNSDLPDVTMSSLGEPAFTQRPHMIANADQEDETIAGEATLRCYEQTQFLKRQKLNYAKESAQRLMVSVRLGSVSSRSSVLHSSTSARAQGCVVRPLLFEAVLPNRKGRANKREHLLWTRVDPLNPGSHSSILTGSSVVLNNCKRPREVRVGVKVNGRLLTYGGDTSRSPKSVADQNVFVSSLSDSVVNAAVNAACRKPCASLDLPTTSTSMCLLNCSELLHTVMKQAPKRSAIRAKAKDKEALRMPPQLECIPLPLDNGGVRVACIAPGTMRNTYIPEIFQKTSDQGNCSVCWTAEGAVEECCKCGVRVHVTCHPGMKRILYDTAVSNGGHAGHNPWMCAVCAESPKAAPGKEAASRRRQTSLPARYQSDMLLGKEIRSKLEQEESPKCTLCPHSGGAMSPSGDAGWVHELCRIWTQNQAPEEVFSRMEKECALCGSESTVGLIKCAGSGCTVRFHPMCARIAVVDDDARNGKVPENDKKQRHERDYRLSDRFPLEILQCGKQRLVPVGFCGFHNPMRERTLYGCYPGGFDASMRVPPYEIQKP